MYTYELTYKPIPDSVAYLKQLHTINPNISSLTINTASEELYILSSTEIYGAELVALDSIIPAAVSTQAIVEKSIQNAIEFGQQLIIKFAAENVLLGITQANMTTAVREATAGAINALQTGSLYDAIAEVRNIPAENKDATFVTDARLLIFINQIEEYLGIPLSTEV